MKKAVFCFFIIYAFLSMQNVWASGAAMKAKRRPRQMNVHQRVNVTQQQTVQPGEPMMMGPAVPQKARQPVADAQVKQIVDISQVWSALEKSSQAWTLMIDQEAKMATVNRFIDLFHKNGVSIKKSSEVYVVLIDSMAQDNPQMLKRPFDQILQVAAIIEYDFNNGQDKDMMALKVLGSSDAVQANKKRLGIK